MSGVAAWFLLLLASEPAATLDTDMPTVRWQLARMRYSSYSNELAGGYVAWIQTADGRGTVFRCDKGVLYAFVAIEPVNIRENLTRLGGTRKERKVVVKVGDYDVREEQWVSIHGGRFLMPRRISTTRRLFRGARDGVFARIENGARDPLTIEVPADHAGVLDRFERQCDLHEAFQLVER